MRTPHWQKQSPSGCTSASCLDVLHTPCLRLAVFCLDFRRNDEDLDPRPEEMCTATKTDDAAAAGSAVQKRTEKIRTAPFLVRPELYNDEYGQLIRTASAVHKCSLLFQRHRTVLLSSVLIAQALSSRWGRTDPLYLAALVRHFDGWDSLLPRAVPLAAAAATCAPWYTSHLTASSLPLEPVAIRGV